MSDWEPNIEVARGSYMKANLSKLDLQKLRFSNHSLGTVALSFVIPKRSRGMCSSTDH